jgi:hypothetical protein
MKARGRCGTSFEAQLYHRSIWEAASFCLSLHSYEMGGQWVLLIEDSSTGWAPS